MIIIRDKKIFESKFAQFESLVRSECLLPNQVFAFNFKEYLFFEYDRVFYDGFPNIIADLLKWHEQPSATWVTFDPDPVNYYSKHFNHFGAASLRAENFNADFKELLMFTEDGNIAEIFRNRPIKMAMFPPNAGWCVYADAMSEIGIIAFKEKGPENYLKINSHGIIFKHIEETLQDPMGYGFTERMLSASAKATLVKNYG